MPIAQEMKNLTEDIAVSYGERMSWLDDFMKDTHQMMSRIHGENKEAAGAVAKLLAHFRGDQKAMAEALGAFLADSESTRISNFKEMLSAIQARQGEREGEVASLLKRFEDELDEMATELEAFLGKSEQQRLEEFRQMLADIKSKQRAREEEVAELLDAFQGDISEARGHWQNLAKIMASKRAGGKIPREAKVPKRVEKAAEEAFEEGDLKVKTMKIVGVNPGGIKLSQIADELNLSYVRLAKPIKELIEEGRVFKRNSLYFPA